MPTPRSPFNVTEWDRLMIAAGLTTETAQALHLGVSRSTVNRVRNGTADPGGKLLRAVQEAFPDQWAAVFTPAPQLAEDAVA